MVIDTMDLEQIQEVAKKYRELLPIQARRYDTWDYHPTTYNNLCHCAYMCDEILAGELSYEKSMRWLCFVQGCLWSNGIFNIESLKSDNRAPDSMSYLSSYSSMEVSGCTGPIGPSAAKVMGVTGPIGPGSPYRDDSRNDKRRK